MQLIIAKILSSIIILVIVLSVDSHRIKDVNSIENHLSNPEHDPSIDHKSFLGTEESQTFDKLLPEESKSRLKKLIIEKVDRDKDGFVTVLELESWMTAVAKLSKERERDKLFPIFSNSLDALMDYEEYSKGIYGGLQVDLLDDVSKTNLIIMKEQDDRKWKLADENQDGKLDRNEFLMFQHPEDYPKMKSIVIQETMEVSDKNKDGFLDLNEYISDIWPNNHPEESLLKQEEDTFYNHRDKNQDKKLDEIEVGEWLMPTGYDPIDAETKHLMHIADTNEDGKLTIEEIIAHYDTFVGSQVTDYGTLSHEEL